MTIKVFARKVLKRLNFLKSGLDKTAECWDEISTATCSEYWWNMIPLKQTIIKEITGNPELSWYTKTIQERPTPFGRVLAFGDGHGMAFEAHLTRKDATEIVYFNISNGEGERFKKQGKDLAIDIPCTFVKADANTYDYSSLGKFDTIIDVGAFHHFQNFEKIFPQLNQILSPEGLMYIDEYVGPSKWKFTQPVIDRINDWILKLPAELVLSRKPVEQNDYFTLWKNSGDPSECIRSTDLERMLLDHFKLVQSASFGGTLLMPFFLSSNLRPCRLNIPNWHNTEVGRREAERLALLEMDLIKSGDIGKDYMYYIFGKK